MDFAQSLEPSSSLQWDGARYVMRPKNFVTFKVHHKRANNLTVTLRGTPKEFEQQPGLQLKADQNGYSIFRLEKNQQLAAAALYVRRAHELFERGRQRPLKTPKTIES